MDKKQNKKNISSASPLGFEKQNKETISSASPLGSPNPIDMYLGGRIAALRKQEEISAEDFAYDLGISIMELNSFEHGYHKIPASLLWYIAAILQEDLNVFFKDMPPQRASQKLKSPKAEICFLD